MRRISIFLVMVLAMSVAPLAFAEAPSNDNLADAEVVVVPFSDTTNTSEATTEVGEIGFGCGGDLYFDPRPNTGSIWYSFTPTDETRVFGSTVGSDYDTVVGVYQKYGEAQVTSFDNLYRVMCEDQERDDVFDFWAQGGQTYYIQIAAHVGETPGTAKLSIELPGKVSGTVTDASGNPIRGICINASRDWVDGEPEGSWDGGWAVTAADGTYLISTLSGGDYVVGFYGCSGGMYEHEYYNDKTNWDDADRVTVARGSSVTGIDASLALRPPPPPPTPSDVSIKSLTVENVALKTDNGHLGYTGFNRKIHLAVENLGPNGTWGEVQVRACPKGAMYVPFVGSLFNGCQWIAWDWDWQNAGTTKTYTFDWNSAQMLGDVTIEAVACPGYGNYDPNTGNNKASVDHYSMVGGSGTSISRYQNDYWDYFGCYDGPIAISGSGTKG